MTLSPEQIQVLFNFTKKKYVHFYDLQSEIVDHLAAAIEDKINENKKFSFEQALEEVYSGFGIFGFAHVVREKEKQIDRKAKRMLWNEFVSLFNWPHLLFSMLILGTIYTLTQWIPLSTLMIIFGGLSLLVMILYLVKLARTPKPAKTLRMLNYYQPGFHMFPFIYVQFYINFQSVITASGFIIFTFLSVIYLVATYKVNTKIRSNAMALYPEAFKPSVSS